MEGFAAVALWKSLELIDRNITLAINSLHCTLSDSVWQFFSDKLVWTPLYIGVLVFFFIRLGWKKALIVTLSCILTLVACDQFGNFTKDFFARLRPCWDPFVIGNESFNLLERRGGYFGFYSAHAADSMGFAVCSLFGFKNDKRKKYKAYSWAICIWALLVGISRVFVGKHFFGDVLVGFAVGALVGWIIAMTAKCLISKTNGQQAR